MSYELFPRFKEAVIRQVEQEEIARKERIEEGEYLLKSPVLPLLQQVGTFLSDFGDVRLTITSQAHASSHNPVYVSLAWGYEEFMQEGKQFLEWREVVVMAKRDKDKKIIGVEIMTDPEIVDDRDIFSLTAHLETALLNPLIQEQAFTRQNDPRKDNKRRSFEVGRFFIMLSHRKPEPEEKDFEGLRFEGDQLLGFWHDDNGEEHTKIIDFGGYDESTFITRSR